MYGSVKDEIAATLQEIKDAGLYKNERELTSPQSAHVTTRKAEALNFCANNYLGLANHPRSSRRRRRRSTSGASAWRRCASSAARRRCTPTSSDELATFLGTEATILYSSCFDANGGVFEVLFGAEDAIISDELNHASIIDGIRLSKAMRYRYKNADMTDLRAQLEAAVAAGAKRKVVVTDGVFSMDGSFAPLDEICDLADEFGALVFVDDSHAVGFVGDGGRGTPELFGVMDRVDILTGTLGKALGGASGGYVASHQEVVDLLRQRSRPYLFSNSRRPGRRRRLDGGARARRGLGRAARDAEAATRRCSPTLMTEAGFDLLPGDAPDHARSCSPARTAPAGPRRSPTTCSATASTSSPSASPWSRAARRASASSCRPRTPRTTCGLRRRLRRRPRRRRLIRVETLARVAPRRDTAPA